jgi:TPR repeat protein
MNIPRVTKINARNGDVSALSHIINAYILKDYEVSRVFPLTRLAASQGDVGSQMGLSHLYSHGEQAVAKDVLTSMEYFLMVAKLNRSDYSFKHIAELFLDEHETDSVDEYKALEWFTQAKDTEKTKMLSDQGIYLRGPDKGKPF